MADLNQACANMGLDSSKLRPIAHATPTGRVAVYIGAAWQELPLGKAMNLRDQLSASIEKIRTSQDRGCSCGDPPCGYDAHHGNPLRTAPEVSHA
jgi:hypothetical protein